MFKAFFGSASASFLTATLMAAATFSPSISAANETAVSANYGKLPLIFEPNRGQTDERVKFLSRGRGYSLYLTESEAVLSLQGADDKSQTLRMKLLGAEATPKVTGLDRLPGVSNYFIGRDRSKWRTGVPHYARVGYEGVYSGIDLVFYGTGQRRLEYDFVVAPGADPDVIALRFEGAERLEIDADGNLVATLSGGEVRFLKPVVYQEDGAEKQPVAGDYVLKGNRVGFDVAAYDRTKPLIIDPVLAYSTFLGGNGEDDGRGIAVDSEGSAYVTGMTDSTNFPVTDLTEYSGSRDVFVAKLSPDGSDLIYSTYLGGESSENAFDIAVDGEDNAYVTGDTQSNGFPVVSAFRESGSGAFVAKLGPTGNLIYATYLGAGTGFGIAVKPGCPTFEEPVCNIYVTGSSEANFPVTIGAFQTLPAGAFLAVLDPTTTGPLGLVYGTFLGGSGGDVGVAIAVGGNGDAYLTGRTTSDDFPTTPNALDWNCAHEAVDNDCGEGGVSDTFVTVLRPLNAGPLDLIYSSYLGGAIGSFGQDIAVMPGCDSECLAFVTGQTTSVDFPTTQNALLGGHLGGHSDSDAFVTVIDTAIDTLPIDGLVYSTFFGGTGGLAIAADDLGRAYIAGQATASGSGEIPIRDPILPDISGVFVAVIDTMATGDGRLLFSTYLGNGSTWGIAVDDVVDDDGYVVGYGAYVIGSTGSEDFPIIAGAFQEELAFNEPSCSACQKNSKIRTLNLVTTVDAFVTKIAGPFSATGAIIPVAVPIRPVAMDDGYMALEDATLSVSAAEGVLDNDTPGAEAILIRNALNGTVVFTEAEDGRKDGRFVYTPNAGFGGRDHFAYAAFDGQAESNVAVAVIDVENVIDEPPVATNDTYRVVVGQTLTVIAPGVLANDTDIENDPLTADLVSGSDPANGTLSLNSDGSFTYTPNANFSGTDTFAYKANDGSNDSVDPATVTITVVGSAIMHVGDLDEIGSSLSGSDWRATVRIYVHDTLEQGVSEATVTGVWTDSVGYGNTVSCTIVVQLDYCDVGSGAIPSPIRKWSRANVTFTVTNISSEPLPFPYDATANHDADGDSDGTSITVFRPGPNK